MRVRAFVFASDYLSLSQRQEPSLRTIDGGLSKGHVCSLRLDSGYTIRKATV